MLPLCMNQLQFRAVLGCTQGCSQSTASRMLPFIPHLFICSVLPYMVGLKTKKEESPCFRDHVVFPSLPCGLSNEDQLCMSFQEARLFFALFFFFKVFSFCSLTWIHAITEYTSVPVRSALERLSKPIGRGLFSEHSAVFQR